MDLENIDVVLDRAVTLIRSHQGLINSYVTDFFVGAQQQLPAEWLSSLNALQPWELAPLMGSKAALASPPPAIPPSLAAFQERCCALNFSDGPVGQVLFQGVPGQKDWSIRLQEELHSCPEAVPAPLRKVMKPKKQHEVVRQGQLIAAVAATVRTRRVLDIGAGHGHLARFLTFAKDLHVTAIEAADHCAPKASKLDLEAQHRLGHTCEPPRHLTSYVSTDAAGLDGMSDLEGPGPGPDCLLNGLHTCGDLTPTLLRLFASNSHHRALVSVGCCYMRCGQPWQAMSRRLRESGLQLSFEALELACHHISSYRERLLAAESSGVWRLKGQAFRAGFTLLLARAGHQLQHGTGIRCGLRTGSDTSFRKYAESLIARLRLEDLDLAESDWKDLEELMERRWPEVIAFCSIRLMLGPVIELLLLLDRVLFLREQGLRNNCIVRLFECQQSPRNLAIVAWKDTERS